MIVDEKMTALADEIRELNGTANVMGLDAMAINIGEANDKIEIQANLISQIATALEGKAAGGSGGSVETCTVKLQPGYPYTAQIHKVSYMSVDSNSLITCKTIEPSQSTVTLTDVMCNSIMFIKHSNVVNFVYDTNNVVAIDGDDEWHVLLMPESSSNMNEIIITIGGGGGGSAD